MGLPLLLASGYLVFPLMYIVDNVIKTWIKGKKCREQQNMAIAIEFEVIGACVSIHATGRRVWRHTPQQILEFRGYEIAIFGPKQCFSEA